MFSKKNVIILKASLHNFSVPFLFVVFFLICFINFAKADTITSITGSSWPVSGSASSGNSGLSSITGGTYVGSTDIPTGSESTGYIKGADNAALTFRVDPTNVPLQTSSDYWLRFWVKASTNGGNLPSDGATVQFHFVTNSGTKISTVLYFRNSSTAGGFGPLVSEFLPGGTSENIYGVTASSILATIPLNEWNEITIHMRKDGKNGEYAFYFNRSLIRRFYNLPTLIHSGSFVANAETDLLTTTGHGLVEGEAVTLTNSGGVLPEGLGTGTTYYVRNPTADTFQLSLTSTGNIIDINTDGTGTNSYTNGGISLSALGSQWTMNLGAMSGITWQISGPILTSSSATIDNSPLLNEFARSTDWVTKIFTASFIDLTYGGDFWKTVSGSLNITPTIYSSSGVVPNRKRFILSGSESETSTLQIVSDIGDLPYNEYGWATLFFPMLYVPDNVNGTLNIIVKDTEGNSISQIDVMNGYLKQGGENIAPWNHSDRYFLALHFSNLGEINYSLHDMTATVFSNQNFWSGSLSGWTPRSLGRVQYVVTRGDTDLELDGLVVARWLPLFGVDSLSHAYANLVVPDMSSWNHITRFASTDDVYTLPGSVYRYKSSGLPRFFSWGIVGRAGRTRQNFNTSILPYMTGSRGIVMTFVDGGSINDIGPINSDESTRVTVVNNLIDQLTTAVEQLISSQNMVWLTTMIERVQGSTYTTTERNAILDFNNGIRDIRQNYPNTYFSDPAQQIADPSTLFSAGDDVHFSSSGTSIYSQYMADGLIVDGISSAPFTINVDSINPTGDIKIYGDGKYRYVTATSSTVSADFSVSPAEGFWSYSSLTARPEWLNISDIVWNTSGTHSKQWTASSTIATTTIFTIGDLLPNTSYTIAVDGVNTSTQTSDSVGRIIYTYSNNYSTHVFTVNPTPILSSPNNENSVISQSGGMTTVARQAFLRNLYAQNNQVCPENLCGVQGLSSLDPKTITISFDRNLWLGQKGSDVKSLQKYLNQHGYKLAEYSYGSPGFETEMFGNLTKSALVKFQRDNNIPATGFLGPITREFIRLHP